MTSIVERWRQQLQESADNYGLVLVLTVLAIAAQALPAAMPAARPIVFLTLSASILASLRNSHIRPRFQALASVVIVLALAVAFLGERVPREVTGAVLTSLSLLLFLCPLAILARIGRHRRVTSRTLFGAVVVYLQLGMSFTIIYLALDSLNDAAISNATPGQVMGYTYFSFVTMSTLGYGDFVPTSNLARLMAIGEAVLGQIFLVTIVARLVSLLGTAEPGPETDRGQLHGPFEKSYVDPEEIADRRDE